MTFTPQPTRYRDEVFPSQRALARARGVSDQTVSKALERGTVDYIGQGRGVRHPCIVDGVAYPSQAAASRSTGIPQSTLSVRLARQRRET